MSGGRYTHSDSAVGRTGIVWMPTGMWGAHWRHLANTTEQSVCDGDAVLCHITLTTCHYELTDVFKWVSLHLAGQTAVEWLNGERPVMYTRQVRRGHGSTCDGGVSRRHSDISGDVMIGAVLCPGTCLDDVTSPS